MKPVEILLLVLLLNLAAIFLTGQFLERKIRRHAVRHDGSFAELARQYKTISAKLEETQRELEELEKDIERYRAEDAAAFHSFQLELWGQLKRLENGTMDGTAEFEEGVRSLLTYTAGKVPGVKLSL